MARPRLHDDGFLAFLREQPCCCGCGRPAPSEAAHIRIGFLAMQKKPDDRYAVPLNRWCHREAPLYSQHHNEREFWRRRGVDPFTLAARFYAQYGGTGGKPRKRSNKITRKPKGQRAKIPSRPFPKQHRPMRSKRR